MATNKDILIHYYGFTDAQWETSLKYLESELLDPGSHIFRPGGIAQRMGIATHGIFRSYSIDENGKETSLQFFTPGTLILSYDSFFHQVPSIEGIVADTECRFVFATLPKLRKLILEMPEWETICNDAAESRRQHFANRLTDIETLSNEERYQRFCSKYPVLARSVQLRHIASYLGMDVDTLVQIRKNI
jgi:CRP-like cAMP-binding protein